MKTIDDQVMTFLDDPNRVLLTAGLVLLALLAALYSEQVLFFTRLIVKSLRRNILRTLLTSLATVVLVLVVVMVCSVLFLLELVTAEKSKDQKAIVTERWQIPSQMPYSYEAGLCKGGARKEGDIVPEDSMTWTFFGGTIDPEKRTRDNIVFFFAMDPAKMMRIERDTNGVPKRDARGNIIYHSMMGDVDQMTEAELDLLDRGCREMEKDRRKVIIARSGWRR